MSEEKQEPLKAWQIIENNCKRYDLYVDSEKFRIKKVNYIYKESEFMPQVRTFWGWRYLISNGEYISGFWAVIHNIKIHTDYESAKNIITLYKKNNSPTKSIDYLYNIDN